MLGSEPELAYSWPDAEWGTQVNLLLGHFDQDLSHTDAVSLVACQLQPTITQVFAFDHHLGLTGLTLMPRLRLHLNHCLEGSSANDVRTAASCNPERIMTPR